MRGFSRGARLSSLSRFRRNVHSQFGEDGVIDELCRRLEIRSGFFAEFGAWDGKHLSNTSRLLELGWSGVYIEEDARKFAELQRNVEPFRGSVVAINARVEESGENRLDALLRQACAPAEFELLSIDVDSCDWHIWKSLRDFRPKIVIIEVISSIPVGVFQTHRGDAVNGSSFTATLELGRRKGYTAVCHTGNLILVRDDLVEKVALPEDELLYPELLFDYSWRPAASPSCNSAGGMLRDALQRLRRSIGRIRRRGENL